MSIKRMMVFGGWLLAGSAMAQVPDTTLTWLTRTALERHPLLRATAADAEAARSRAASAGALSDPELMVGYNATMRSGSALGRASAGLRQTLPWPGTRQAGRDAASAAATARGHARDVARVAVVRDLADAWHARHGQARQADLLLDHSAWLARLEALARQRLSAGYASRADVLRLEMEREELRSMIRQLRFDIDAMDATLRRLSGLSDDEPLPAPSGPIPSVRFTIPTGGPHPMIAESAAMGEEADRMIRLTELETRPMIGVGVDVMGPNFQSMSASRRVMIVPAVTVSLPIWSSRNKALVEEARQRGSASKERLAATTLTLEVERTEAVARYRQADDQVTLIRDRLLPKSIELADLVLAEYSSGRGSAEAVISARRQTLDLQLRLAQAQSDRNRSIVTLESLYPVFP